jgi:hypothetical protein
MKNILLLIITLNSFIFLGQDKLEVLSKYNYVTTTQFDGTKRTSKFLSILASVDNTNNFIIVDQKVKESKSVIYLNNMQKEENTVNGKIVIHYDSPKYGKNQLAYWGKSSMTLILPNKQTLIFSISKPKNTTMVKDN